MDLAITGLIVAMDKEADLIKGAMSEVKEEKRGHLTFYRGRLHNADIVLHVSGPGKVSATIGCVEMINAYRPAAIINSGVAGGLAPEVRRGDMVIGREIRYHDVWCGEGSEKGQMQGLPACFTVPERWVAALERLMAAPAARPAEADGSEPPRLHFGLLCSGDRFITTAAEVEAIRADFPGALAVDMESGALAQTCYLYGVPFLCCRIVSDTPGATADAVAHFAQYNDFWQTAPARSAAFLSDLLARLL